MFFVEKNKGRKCNGGGGEGGRSLSYKFYFVSNITCKNITTSQLFTNFFLIPSFFNGILSTYIDGNILLIFTEGYNEELFCQ